MTEKIKVGIISAAWGVQAHLPAWRSLDDVEVVAICTSRQETADAAARQNGIAKAYGDFREMARDPDIDIIDVGTRPRLRHEMVSAALERDKHVYAGMPFGMSAREARDMCDLQQARGRVGAVDATVQPTPAGRLMKEMIDDHLLGDISGISCDFQVQLFTAQSINVPDYVWFADASQGASVLRNLGGHALHAIVSLFGPVREVVGTGSTKLKSWPVGDGTFIEPGVHDNAFLLLRLESGVDAQLNLSWNAANAHGFNLEVWGSRGRLALKAPGFPQAFSTTLHSGPVGGYMDEPDTLVPIPDRLMTIPRGTLRADMDQTGVFTLASIFRDFVDAVRAGREASPSFAQAAHVQAIVDGAERSYVERCWIPVTGDPRN